MPQMKLNRKYRLASTTGHVVLFEVNKPTYVPPALVEAAVGVGAVACDEADADELQKMQDAKAAEAAASPPQPEGTARRAAIDAAMRTLRKKNERGAFMASGRPKPAALRAILGFDVDPRERDEIWDAIRAEDNS